MKKILNLLLVLDGKDLEIRRAGLYQWVITCN